jgi:16S rRNA (adenine1518-N6/adenine1519-N6)-dimethyltransferase
MLNVPRNVFWPQPKVDSCIVKLVPKAPPFELTEKQVFFDVTKAIFSHRRKKIMNSLMADPAVSSLVASLDKHALETLPYSSQRAEELTPEKIGELSNALLALTRQPPGRSAQ